jgi:signal transduction histidine kinase
MKCDRKTIRYLERSVVLALFGVVLCPSILAQVSNEGQKAGSPQKEVMLLYSQRKDGPYSATFERVIQQTLNVGMEGRIDFYQEYIDEQRFFDQKYRAALSDFIRRKYGDQRYDLIVAIGGAAVSFAADYGAELFPETPVVFYGGQGRARPNFTGVVRWRDLRSTIEVALRVQPNTKNVFVISGSSERDLEIESIAREQLQALEDRVAFTYLNGLSMNELIEKVSHLPAASIIYYLNVSGDRTGTRYSSPTVMIRVCAAANTPVYGPTDWQVNDGAFGGSVLDGDSLAKQTAEIALRVLRGEKAEDIPVAAPPPNVNMFDWRQLRRWGISEESLPPGSVVRFKELSIWEQHKGRIIGALVLIALQASLIAVLLVERKRRQRAIEALDILNIELEKRVGERTSALASKTRELEAFTYTVAHDLKAPLRGIDGYSRLLLEDYFNTLDDEGQGFLQRIRSSADQMKQLIEDLLAYSQADRREMIARRIELQPFIEKLIEERSSELKARGINLTLELNGDSAICDPAALAQAMRNYLDNSIKFTREATEPRIEIGSESDGRVLRLWVRDNGTGFDLKYHDQIFGIFQRLHRAEEYPGTGIGLAIVRKAIERMNGRVWAESESGQGAMFFIEIPAPPEETTGC